MRDFIHKALRLVPPLERFVTTVLRAWWLRIRYRHNVRRVSRKYASGDKIRILFLVSEAAKWKLQSLFDRIASDDRLMPFVALSIADTDWKLTRDQRIEKLSKMHEFFKSMGMACEMAYDNEADEALPLNRFHPDLVFYTQPWFLPPCQCPRLVSKYALTFYVPYFVPTFANKTMHCCLQLHKDVYRHFVLNEDWRKFYIENIEKSSYAGEIVALGHPMLDSIHFNSSPMDLAAPVIYAPHWSIPHPKNPSELNLSTFAETGVAILNYAVRHPEVNWVFRPHPTLPLALKRTGLMSEREIANYYDAWGKIGTISSGGGYTRLFNESRTLITDCDSFLSEYACTGNPIVHLVSGVKSNRTFSPLKRLFDTYYKVEGLSLLERTLDQVVVSGEDPKREDRLSELRRVRLCPSRGGEDIYGYVKNIIAGRI